MRRIMRTALFLALLTGASHVPATAQSHRWSHGHGGEMHVGGRGIAADRARNIVVTGLFLGTADFGGGPITHVGGGDIFVAKYDARGRHVWSQRFGGVGLDRSRAIAVDVFGNILVTGSFQRTADFGGGPLTSAGAVDVFLAKYDARGNHIWSRRFGGTGAETGISVDVDRAGNVLLTGEFQRTVDFGGGPMTSAGSWDVFVVRLDFDGDHIWSRRFGDSGADAGWGIAADVDGNALVTGEFMGTMDLGGGPRSSAGFEDIFVAKYDASGQHIWSRRFGLVDTDRGLDIAVDGSGNVLVTGRTYLGDFGGGVVTVRGLFVAKFDPDGSHIWSQGYFGNLDTPSIAVDGAGNVVVAGDMKTSVNFGGDFLSSTGTWDVFVVRFDPDGRHLWSERFGDQSTDRGRGVAVDALGNILATGFFQDTIDFGGSVLTSAGNVDTYIAKFGSAVARQLAQLDIKPGSCPNPLNVQLFEFRDDGQSTKGGVMPVALLGTSEFDVAQVDVSSVRLEGIEPLSRGGGPRSVDVAGPTINGDDCGCMGAGPDGTIDLMMHFSRLEIAAVIPPGKPGDELVLTLSGKLLDGSMFEARDCIVFVGPSAVPGARLGAAFPNPFNPVTRISYVLPDQGHTMLAVYDVRGRRVATLVDAVMSSGEHTVTWNAKGIASGVYFYRLTAGDFSETCRMVLLK